MKLRTGGSAFATVYPSRDDNDIIVRVSPFRPFLNQSGGVGKSTDVEVIIVCRCGGSHFDTVAAAYHEAIVRDPRHSYLYQDLAKLASEHQRWDTAATAATNALRLHPFATANYTPAMVGHVEAAVEAYLAGDAETGRRHRDEALAIENRLAELRQRAETLKSLWPNSQPKPGAEYRLRLGQALAMAGNYKEALPHLQAAQKQEDLRIQADIWTYMVLAGACQVE